jgi:hypothetical protein
VQFLFTAQFACDCVQRCCCSSSASSSAAAASSATIPPRALRTFSVATTNTEQTGFLCADAIQPKVTRGTSCGTPLKIVSANYVVRATWAKGYVVDVSVVVDCLNSARKNRFGVDGFRVGFDLNDGASIVKTWNAKMTQEGSVCTACHMGFCAPVHREQAVLYFGFEARLEMSPPRRKLSMPASITVNGQLCVVNASFARDLADCRNDDFESDDEDDAPHATRVATPEPAQNDQMISRKQRSSSAPPVLYTYFGLASPSSGSREGDYESHLSSTTSVCADTWKWNDDEDQSVAETVSDRVQGRQQRDACTYAHSEVEDSSFTVLTPPLSSTSSHAACSTPPTTHAHNASRKRKFFEEDEDHHDDHDDILSCQSNAAPHTTNNTSGSSKTTRQSAMRYPKTLHLEYYRRSKALKKRKYLHMDYLDSHFRSREQVILNSVLDDSSKPIVLEPNMFPYDTPTGVTHWTLWSRKWLQEDEIDKFVDGWLAENMPEAVEWNHDDNMADGLSINLFHLHVYVRC